MRVLIACEFSGIVREEFRALGHEAFSCDLLETEIPSDYHLQCDVSEVLDMGWDLMIAHPPCTCLTNAGVRWLYKNGRGTERDPERWKALREGADFFNMLLTADIPRICIENPIMHRFARELVHRKNTQIIQPWMFGVDETKATCLWLSGLPELKPDCVVAPDYVKYPRVSG